MKRYAKDEICDCKTAKEILMKAELLIEEDWLDKVDALPGNLFCLGAFGDIIPEKAVCFSSQNLKAYSKYMGCVLIIIIQLCAPCLLFFSRMPGNMGIPDESAFVWDCHPLFGTREVECPSGKPSSEVKLFDDWDHIATTKALGIIFILTFILNGLFVVMEEQKTWRDLYNTFKYLDWKNESFDAPGEFWLFFGALVNCWVVIWSCLDMYVVVGASESPQDLLLDALGLLFLYRLDDIGGDLQFIDADDWPGRRIAWIYQELVHPWPDTDFDEDKLDRLGTVCTSFYKIVAVLICMQLCCIPVLAVITPFRDIAPND
jgi:hypothetical protein